MSVHGYSHCLWENGRGVLTRCVKLKSQWLEEVPLAGGSANTYAVRSVSRPPHGPAERDRSELLVMTTRGYDSAVSVDWARSIRLAEVLEA
jgi:hypothetical protein